jgi:hypothetical protein
MDRVRLLLLLTASSCVAVVTGAGLDEARTPWPVVVAAFCAWVAASTAVALRHAAE